MPRCIVCKGYYDSGTKCDRCQSDNTRWIEWQRNDPVEQDGFLGLLRFTGVMPILVVDLSLALGLIGLAVFWKQIRVPISILAVIVTLLGNLIIIGYAYEDRLKFREKGLLAQWRTAIRKKGPIARLGPQLKAIVIPTAILVVLLAIVMVDLVWGLVEWVFYEPIEKEQEVEPDSALGKLKERVLAALPLILMVAYVSCSLGLTYYLSFLSSQQYASRMNRALPQPIFLRGDLLARVVKEEVQKHLFQTGQPSPAQPSSSTSKATSQAEHRPEGEPTRGSADWAWVDLERTNDGGIRFTAWVECESSQVEESITGLRTKQPEFVNYTVEADRWGRIVRVARGERVPPP